MSNEAHTSKTENNSAFVLICRVSQILILLTVSWHKVLSAPVSSSHPNKFSAIISLCLFSCEASPGTKTLSSWLLANSVMFCFYDTRTGSTIFIGCHHNLHFVSSSKKKLHVMSSFCFSSSFSESWMAFSWISPNLLWRVTKDESNSVMIAASIKLLLQYQQFIK